jgi:BMFP domain-containing protein YqiC
MSFEETPEEKRKMSLFDKNSLDALKNKVAEEQTKAQKELSDEADAKARHASNRSEIIKNSILQIH